MKKRILSLTMVLMIVLSLCAVGGRTMVPARAIADAFGCTVGWDGENRVITIE